MIEHSLRVLEYYRLLDILSKYAASPLGRSDCLLLKPSRNLEHIEAEQRLVSEMKELLLVKGFISLSGLADLRPLLRKARKKGAYLEPKELLSVRNLITTSLQARTWIHEARELCPSLAEIVDSLPACHDLAEHIGRSLTEDGAISDCASPLLASLRSRRVASRRVVEKKLDDLIGRLEFRDENLISIRDGRYVISVRTDKRNYINGIVHGYSRSHSTSFLEPLTVVEENNQLVELIDREKDEERRILERLTGLVSQESSELLTCLEGMGKVDGLFARAEFSSAINGTTPIFTSQKSIYLLGALNPILVSLYLESSKGGTTGDAERVIPIEVDIDAKKSILIISGPNRGGKTVALKTIGLLALMAQAGMHIPAREGSRLGVFDTILAEIGDDQDISAGLSTFSARLEHLKEIVGWADENSLIMLDELGTGTDPAEGASLAMAILDYLSGQDSLVAISTHYQSLKRYGLINKKAQNASVEFDNEEARPTFRLLTGMPGVSHAIEVARDAGIMPEIIETAAHYLGKDRGKSDVLMEELAKMMEEVKAEKDAVTVARQEYVLSKRRLEEERQRLGEHVDEVLLKKDREAERVLADAKRGFSEAIGYLKKKGPSGQFDATQRYMQAKKGLVEAMAGLRESRISDDHIPITVGQKVYHKQWKKSGVVVKVDENSSKAQIKMGSVKLSVDFSELIPESKVPAQQKEDKRTEKQWSLSILSEDKEELNLIGYRVVNALPLVDRMIDQAVVHGYAKLKIIHGIGSGTLRNAIRKSLKENGHVKNFFPEGGDGGNNGITIVEL